MIAADYSGAKWRLCALGDPCRAVAVGDAVRSPLGVNCTIAGGNPPSAIAPTGRLLVDYPGGCKSVHPSAYGVMWVLVDAPVEAI